MKGPDKRDTDFSFVHIHIYFLALKDVSNHQIFDSTFYNHYSIDKTVMSSNFVKITILGRKHSILLTS